MISWASKRKLFFFIFLVALGAGAFALYSIPHLYTAPSCTDGKQNQDETGVDCGGSCALLCKNQSRYLTVNWQRSFEVARGLYNTVAYIENLNEGSEAKEVPYVFKLYDDKNILLAERAGTMDIPPRHIVPIVETNLQTGTRAPVRTVFVFEAKPVWNKVSRLPPIIRIHQQTVSDIATNPLITALLVNDSDQPVWGVRTVVIVYDESDNARAVSETVADEIKRFSSSPIQFSWPHPFDFRPARIEIIPLLYPDSNY